jgi:hypothetical protein
MRIAQRVVITMGLALVVDVRDANAWGENLHRDLTAWLAFNAGFSAENARIIAEGDQSYDTSPHHAAVHTMIGALRRGDQYAARDVQVKHFPHDGRPPAPPAQRYVHPGSAAAYYAVNAAVARTTSADALFTLGESLHPFQDSWSHQGEPDVPLRPGKRLKPDISYSHPKTRGGWWRHDADLAHLHPRDVEEVAKATWNVLRAFLRNNPRFVHHKPTNVKLLEPILEDFIAADTRAERKAWKRKHLAGVYPASMLSAADDEIVSVRTIKPSAAEDCTLAPADLVAEAQRFFDAWLSERNVSQAAEYVDQSQVREDFKEVAIPFGTEEAWRWANKFLTSYLIEDHDAVNEMGHGNPEATGYVLLPADAQSATDRFALRSTQSLQVWPGDFAPSYTGQNPRVEQDVWFAVRKVARQCANGAMRHNRT